ncbi:hypothetical protein AXG93_4525s1120 [Marchantia polymorpha subsp. ruderalis]|uniref:DDE-1 domain-containing protein n=1 Tax=Marchantia polymorpha subsp. ruderalis TaxID=1480154 RepID=A0A176WI23_MARPO|nr:hypothetical protein AXG93_4525s1120 [Marchantia polymorpha subsp. ruderalis]
MQAVATNLEEIQQKVASFQPANVYNMDETELFYEYAPDRTMIEYQLEGLKKSKKRFTIAFIANTDGSHKLEHFFIGHAKHPRCFKKKTASQLEFLYRNNKKAWMTGVLFQEWLKNFDAKMKEANRSILLLLDNAPGHIFVELENIVVLFLPPNTTSKLQPMDALWDRAKAAWNEIIPVTIHNCFWHAMVGRPLHTISHLNQVMNALQATPQAHENGDVTDVEADAIEHEIAAGIQAMGVAAPIPVRDFINPTGEEESSLEDLTDEELVQMMSNEST